MAEYAYVTRGSAMRSTGSEASFYSPHTAALSKIELSRLGFTTNACL